jgi:hypothetical protein
VRAEQNPADRSSRSHSRIALFVCAAALIALFAHTVPAADKIEWKPVPAALLRVDDRPPATWNLYTADKKNDRLLIQLGGRYLFVDTNRRQVYELDPAKLDHKGDSIIWLESDRPADSLAESAWITHDVGEAYRIHFRLDTEGRVFDIDIPHPVVAFGP